MINQLKCDHRWPICIFDFTVTKTLHEFFVFKVGTIPTEGVTAEEAAEETDLRRFVISTDYVQEEHDR